MSEAPAYMILTRFTKMPREKYWLGNIEPVTKEVGKNDGMLWRRYREAYRDLERKQITGWSG